MSVRVVRLATPRIPGDGPRIGTVRRPPRGVPKEQFSAQNSYDVWFPNLAPSLETMKLGLAASSPAQWSAFARKYKAEMAAPGAKHDLQLLAVLSHASDFSVGCYCEHEARCHRSILKQLLAECGAKVEWASEPRRCRACCWSAPQGAESGLPAGMGCASGAPRGGAHGVVCADRRTGQ